MYTSIWIGLLRVGVVYLLLLVAAFRMEADAQSPLPNIVIILADDLGFGDLSCQNPASKISTPRLDALASGGIRFTDAHAPSSVCSPTRYALLTGTYAWRSRLQRSVLWPWDGPLIDEDTQTLPGMLRAAGYNTACIGKWHLGWDWATRDGSSINDVLPIGTWEQEIRSTWADKIDFTQVLGGGPVTRGFDYYFGDDVPNFPPYCFIENDRLQGTPDRPKPEAMFGAPGPMVEGWDLTAVMPTLTEKAVAYIHANPGQAPFDKKMGQPFFLYLPLTAPHTPIAPTDAFIGKSAAHRYGDFVAEVDWTVGQVVDALKAAGQLENTLLIFTSDNGSPARDGENMAGPPGSVLAYGHRPSAIYRGMKADIWEGGHRVPFIAYWPGHVPAGAISNEIISLTDVMATVARITGASLAMDAARDSYNILPALQGAQTFAPIREATVHHSINGIFAIRQGVWKYIEGKGSGGWSKDIEADAPEGQLYNLAEDPGETKNLYRDNPETVVRLKALLDRYKTEGRSVPAR